MEETSTPTLWGYCDVDYARDKRDMESTSGYCTFIGGNLVTWKSKKQKVVLCSRDGVLGHKETYK